jgi:hypothetical protein
VRARGTSEGRWTHLWWLVLIAEASLTGLPPSPSPQLWRWNIGERLRIGAADRVDRVDGGSCFS